MGIHEVKKVGIILLAKGKFSVIVKRSVSCYEEKNSEKKRNGKLIVRFPRCQIHGRH